MGLVVGAACVAASFLLPGIGAVASAALFGAGVSTLVSTTFSAAGELSSGNVRSLKEAVRDTAISVIVGAVAGQPLHHCRPQHGGRWGL